MVRDTDLMTRNGHQQLMPRTLADLRRSAGKSLTDVAQSMGVTKKRVSHIEARYPNLNYDTVTRYMQAIGVRIQFALKDIRVNADAIGPDPDKFATSEYLASRPGKGNLVYVQPSAAAKELPLKQSSPEPGGDDTGRDVDEGHSEGDQGDRENGQQG